MEVSREKQPQKERKKKERRSTKTVNLEDTNRYQHWEMRAAFIGAMMHYNPQVITDMNTAGGVEKWFDTLKQQGATIYPFREPKLIPK
jgi:hypothetical protein